MLCNRLKYHLKNFSETTMNNIIKRFLLGNLLFTCVPLMSVSDGSINQLFEAAESGDFETLECSVNTALHKKIDFKNVRDNNGNSLLHAIMRGLQEETDKETTSQAINIIRYLATSGLDINIRNSSWQTPAHKLNMIQSASTQLSLLKTFHALGAKFDSPDTTNKTVLGSLLTDISAETSNKNSATVQSLIVGQHTKLFTKLPRTHDHDVPTTFTLAGHFVARANRQIELNENYDQILRVLYSSSEVRAQAPEDLVLRLKKTGWKEGQ